MLLWHYTNLSSLLGIIESKELWATDLRYLNDRTEFAYGLEQVLNVLRDERLNDGKPDYFQNLAML